MPFFSKAEAGSAVSDMLDERLRQLQQQMDESRKACDGLRGEVLAFSTAAREMCRCAGSTVQALGAALDTSHITRDDGEEGAITARDSMEWRGSGPTNMRRATLSGSPRNSGFRADRRSFGGFHKGTGSRLGRVNISGTEPLRSELLAFQMNECATEMEDDIMVQVLQPLEGLHEGRDEIQAAIKERARAADGLAVAHREYARAVARCQPHSTGGIKGEIGGGPPADVVQLGDQVVRASDAFAEAHGHAENALTGILSKREEILEGAMLSLKALQAVFFVRVGHCISSSAAPTPPPTPTRRHSLAVTPKSPLRPPLKPAPVTESSPLPESTPRAERNDESEEKRSDGDSESLGSAEDYGESDPESGEDCSESETASPGSDESVPASPLEPPDAGDDEAQAVRSIAFFACASDPMDGDTPRKSPRFSDSGSTTDHQNVEGDAREVTETRDNNDDYVEPCQGVESTERQDYECEPKVEIQQDVPRRRRSSWFRRFTSPWNLGNSSSPSIEERQDLQSSCPSPVPEESPREYVQDKQSPVRVDVGHASESIRDESPLEREDGTITESQQECMDVVDVSGSIEGYTDSGGGTLQSTPSPNGPRLSQRDENELESQSTDYLQISPAEGARDIDAESVELESSATESIDAGGSDVESGGDRSDDSDSDETGSNTTEGFGSDAAGELWSPGVGRDGFVLERASERVEVEENGNRSDGNAELGMEGGDEAQLGDRDEVILSAEAVPRGGHERQSGCVSQLELNASETLPESAELRNFAPSAEPVIVDPGNGVAEGNDEGGKTSMKDCRPSQTLACGIERDGSFAPPVGIPIKRTPLWPRSPTPVPTLPLLPESPPAMPTSVTQVAPLDVSISLTDESPARSETSRDSPLSAWRLSWWSRASDRHQPPPPLVIGADENEAVSACSLATTPAPAAAGGEAASVLTAGGGTVSSLPGNGGNGPAAVDGVSEMLTDQSEAVPASERDITLSGQGHTVEPGATSMEVDAAAERRAWGRARRRRPRRPWLVSEKLTNEKRRPLEAAWDFLDVIGLARACGVCRPWAERLRAHGTREWTRCVRQAGGIPEDWRARFYMHVLYDQPSWLSKAHDRHRLRPPCSEVYRDCLNEAETEDAARKRKPLAKAAAKKRDGSEEEDSTQTGQDTSSESAQGLDSMPPSQGYKWLEEIDTDVLRTCPEDATPTLQQTLVNKGIESIIDSTKLMDLKVTAARRASVSSADDNDAEQNEKMVHEEQTEKPAEERNVRVMTHSTKSVEFPQVPTEEEASSYKDEEVVGFTTSDANTPSASTKSGTGVPTELAKGVGNGGGTREKLRRVLRAYAVYNRRVSYCQGMNFLALSLLETCAGDDEMAFWILAGMCDRLDLEGLWCEGLERLNFCFFTLERLLKLHCPSLRQHLVDEGVELHMFTSRWFVTLFACNDVFGRGTSRKILDMFLLEKWPLMFKLSLGVLLEMRPLLEPTDIEGILKVTKFPRAQLFGLRRDSTGRRVAGATYEEAAQGSLCESIRAGKMVSHALLLPVTEETLEESMWEFRRQHEQEILTPGSD